MNRKLTLAVAVATAAAVSFPVLANPLPGIGPIVQLTRIVRYRVVELRTLEGAKSVAMRIKSAASYVCGGDDQLTRIYDDAFIPCREGAIDRALNELRAPMVSAALGRVGGEDLSSAE